MAIYEVYGHAEVVCSMRVRADSPEEAVERANKTFGGLISYAGLGGFDKLLGVKSPKNDRTVLPVENVIFDDAQLVDGQKVG